MNIFTRLTTLLGLAAMAVSTWADVPFKPTTITADGQFAEGTTWYTLGNGAGKLRIAANDETKNYIELGGNYSSDDENLWCFVGDETNGFAIYNKKAGTTKALAAPTTMSANTGETSYAYLQTVEGLPSTQTMLWDFKAATTTSSNKALDVTGGYYVNEHGIAANILNNRNNKLAFWSTGYDNGSVITITALNSSYTVDTNNGTLTSSTGSTSFFSTWTSTATNPQLTVQTGASNMAKNDTNINYFSGQALSSTYTISTGTSDYIVTGFSFNVKRGDSSANITITTNGKTYTLTDEAQEVKVEGLEKPSTTFIVAGDNKAAVVTDFVVNVERHFAEPEPQVNVLITTKQPNYRIPAIAKAHNGDLIAVADYRFTGSDIGYGRLDLHAKISSDNGQTWTENPIEVVRGVDYVKGKPTDEFPSSAFLHTGFGDPCIVADRESDRVLLMSCSGDVMFPNGTRDYHQGIARFYSEDNGKTWSKPVDISENIYSQFDTCTIGTAKSMFVGSGRIFQSSTVKVGNYYRLYCSVLFKDVNGTNKNYVLYSDDFGGEWKVLGGVNVAPIPSGADEPKAEELPDGSVICSSRVYGGRMYNIFHFTNSEKAEGYWDKCVTSNANNKGVVATGNSCNGEVMILPAQRKADGKDVYVFLQSVPFGNGRTNVGIFYKELASLNDFVCTDSLAANWDGSHQSSYMGSAYSTMTLCKDNTIGFLYEESTFGKDYTIVYKNYSLEQITDSAYTFKADVNAQDIVKSGINGKIEDCKKKQGNCVGQYNEEAITSIETAAQAYEATPSKDTYEALNAAIHNATVTPLRADIKYRVRNSNRGTEADPYYLVVNKEGTTAAALDESRGDELISFLPEADGSWKIYCESEEVFVDTIKGVEKVTPVVADRTKAATYKVVINAGGLCAFVCTTPTVGSYPALHLAGDCKRIVPWTSDAGASLWYIVPTDITTDIAAVEAMTPAAAPQAIYDLQGRRLNSIPRQGVYITSDRKKRIAK